MALVPYSKSGKSIQGTLENVSGVAGVSCPSDLDPTDHTNWEYDDGTTIFWEGQITVEQDGQVVFIDEDGDEVLESEIEWREE